MEVTSRYQNHDRSRSLFGRGNQTTSAAAAAAAAAAAEDPAADDTRNRRKLQRNVKNDDGDDETAFRKPSLPASAMRQQPNDTKSGFLTRKRSVGRDAQKALHGPRPLDNVGKRVFSEGNKTPSGATSALPSSTRMPSLEPKSSGKQRFSLGGPDHISRKEVPIKEDDKAVPFLPPVNFDDFQSSIASYEHSPLRSSFEAQSGPYFLDTADTSNLSLPPSAKSPQPRSSSDLPRSATETFSARRNQLDVAQNPKEQTTAPRPRRMSAMPAATAPQPLNPVIANAKSPRKSVGPGLLTNMLNNRKPSDYDVPMSAPAPSESTRISPVSRSRRRTFAQAGNATATTTEQSRAMAPTRSSKARSMQPPSRPLNSAQPQPAEPSTPNDPHRRARSSSRPATGRTNLRAATPSSSSANKRQSGRASGLGARTISPTDARRLKRMSMAQPPLPNNKPSPTVQQSQTLPDLLSSIKSPPIAPRKMSLTPSSARETPDSNNMYMSATSLSRSSSYQSLRTTANVSVPRTTQSPSLSRLPTPRARNVYSSAETQDDEVVPPVPAIPKAFGSPLEQVDTPFFTTIPKTMYGDPPRTANSAHSYDHELEQADSKSSVKPRKQSLSVPGPQQYHPQHSLSARPSVDEPRYAEPATPAPRKKASNNQRLPPLSLQPLSTPTAARIAALPQPSQEVDRRQSTPPPTMRGFTKTPSTPMTASKATFHRKYDEDASKPSYGLRSSTSHHALRGVDHSALDQFANAVPVPIPSNKRIVTPFSSGSLPKTSMEYMPNMDHVVPDEYNLGQQEVRVQTSKPMGPRPRTASKTIAKDTASTHTTSSNEDQETSSGTSLRRNFSLNWKRSASKTATHQQNDSSENVGQDSATMLPPKMPASATWTDLGSSMTPTGSTRSSLDMARRKPVQNAASSAPAQVQPKAEPVPAAPRTQYRAMHSNPAPQQSSAPRSSSWTVAGKARASAPTPKPSQADLRRKSPTGSPVLDEDDVAADKEMARLARQRKDVERAAQCTDELTKLAVAKQRMSPAQAIQSSAGLLNIYEKGEIIDYKQGVYFCGTKTAKKHVGDIAAAGTTNFGYDDERGDYNICMGDHLAYRYEVVDVLGKGSFGQVVRCIDHKEGCLVAVKIIRNKKRFHQQALVEVDILNKLKQWDPDGTRATLTVTSSFYFRSHLCIVTPCLSINLYELIKEHSFQGFSLCLIRRFARQILACLQLLQSKRIIHCDLKPENILLCDPRRADIRVIDFGSSCKTDEKVYTYIQSRFYRSPEVILGSEYSLGIDMWSFGCILAELYTGYPIFPGENEQEQLACIMEVFGPPSRDIIEKCSRRKLFFDSAWKPRVTVSSKGRRRRPSSKTLNMALKCDDDSFLDFITQCLRWDPDRRLRADQALHHPFITNEPFRRTDRVRPRTATQPSKTVGLAGAAPSPTKRSAPSATAAVSSTTMSTASQPTGKESRVRPLPQTPSAAVRGMGTAPSAATAKASPVKTSLPTHSRRQSSVLPIAAAGAAGATADPVATAAGKRLSSGIAFGSSIGSNPGIAAQASGLPRMASGRLTSGSTGTTSSGTVDLASAAARESMGVSSARYR